jgi:glycosyltransferase involved in cell wall biosynthesis
LGVEVFSVGDQADLANSINRVLNDLTTAQRGGAELQKKVRQEYNWDKVTESIEDVYIESKNNLKKSNYCKKK